MDLKGVLLGFIGHVPSITGFLMGFIWFYLVFLGFSYFYRLVTGFYLVFENFTDIYRV